MKTPLENVRTFQEVVTSILGFPNNDCDTEKGLQNTRTFQVVATSVLGFPIMTVTQKTAGSEHGNTSAANRHTMSNSPTSRDVIPLSDSLQVSLPFIAYCRVSTGFLFV